MGNLRHVEWLVNLALFVAVTLLSKPIFAHISLDTYPKIILWAAITCVVVIPLFFTVSSMFDRESYHYAKSIIAPYIQRIFRRSNQQSAD